MVGRSDGTVRLPSISRPEEKFTKSKGWKIERKYDNDVLIHNWLEERMQVGLFTRPINSDYSKRTILAQPL